VNNDVSEQRFLAKDFDQLTMERLSSERFSPITEEQRDGDPPNLVADGRLVKEILGFELCHSDLNTIVQSAWRWHQKADPQLSMDTLWRTDNSTGVTSDGAVSVLMTTYAGEQTYRLARSLESIYQQTHPVDQVVLVLDGPVDSDQKTVIARALCDETARKRRRSWTDQDDPRVTTVGAWLRKWSFR
jgi:hypothetical protein